MRAFLKNKKSAVGVIAIMAGLMILLAGLSQAWFSNSGANAGSTITLGDLKVVAELEDTEIELAYPGVEYEDLVGTVQLKEGSLAALVKLSFSTEVTIKSNASGNPLPVGSEYKITNPSTVSFTLQEGGALDANGDILAHPLGAWFNIEDADPLKWGSYIWQLGGDGCTYVWLYGNDVLHFAYTVDTDGPNMGSEYMNAVIKVAVDWEAVQAIPDGAIEDFFSIPAPVAAFFTDYSGSVVYPFDTGTIFSPFSLEPHLSNAEKIGIMAERLVEGAFRTMLERIQEGMLD